MKCECLVIWLVGVRGGWLGDGGIIFIDKVDFWIVEFLVWLVVIICSGYELLKFGRCC